MPNSLTAFTKNSSVAIILLNWNGFEYTKICIESLLQIEYRDYEIIVVDNGSIDGSLRKLAGLFPELTYLESKQNIGFTGGNNLGMEYALKKGFEFIMLLNNDTVVEKDFLGFLVEELQNSPNCAAVQPLIFFLHDRKKIWNAGGEYFPWLAKSKTSYNLRHSSNSYLTDWITGCAIILKAAVIREVGLLDPTYFAYFEDVDWSLRIRKSGYELKVAPLSKIYHEAGASSKSKVAGKEGFLDPKVHYLNIRNQLFQLKKYASFPYGIIAWPYNFLKTSQYVLYFIARGRWTKLKAIGNGIKDGW